MKFCVNCGKENGDQAEYCAACGSRFPSDPSFSAQQAHTDDSNQTQPGLFTVERGPGAHEHILSDFYLKDSGGRLVLAAKKQSLLHASFNIVNSQEEIMGFITPKQHLSHKSLNVESETHEIQQTVQVSTIRGKGQPPKCWVEDSSGSKQFSIVYENSFFAFSGVRVDGSRIFDAAIKNDSGGIRSALTALFERTYSINLLDPTFSKVTLLTIFIAVQPAQQL